MTPLLVEGNALAAMTLMIALSAPAGKDTMIALVENFLIHYVLFNPWAVRSNEALNSFDSPLMKLLARAIYAIVGVSVEKAIAPITHLIDNPPHTALSAFIKTKPVDLTMNTFDRGKAVRLDDITKSC